MSHELIVRPNATIWDLNISARCSCGKWQWENAHRGIRDGNIPALHRDFADHATGTEDAK